MSNKITDGAIEAVCGRCIFWKEAVDNTGLNIGAGRRGNCWGLPPTPYAAQMDRSGRVTAQGNLRPVVPEHEPACSMYADKEMLQQMTVGKN